MKDQTGVKVPSLRHYRDQNLMTQAELAEAAGVVRATVINAERGGSVRHNTVKQLARVLGVKPVKLLEEPPE